MSQVEVDALNIVRGEANGDSYLWDAVWHDASGTRRVGAWKSSLESPTKGE
jgi:hypothetical protein